MLLLLFSLLISGVDYRPYKTLSPITHYCYFYLKYRVSFNLTSNEVNISEYEKKIYLKIGLKSKHKYGVTEQISPGVILVPTE